MLAKKNPKHPDTVVEDFGFNDGEFSLDTELAFEKHLKNLHEKIANGFENNLNIRLWYH